MTARNKDVPTPAIDARGLRVAIVASRFHHEITRSMVDAACRVFLGAGGDRERLYRFETPGAFELTAVCRAIAFKRPAPDAIVAIGCIIAGQTSHDQFLAQSVVQGLTSITVQTGVPIGFGVLTCPSLEHARARSIDATSGDVSANKGAEAMLAAIETAMIVAGVWSANEVDR